MSKKNNKFSQKKSKKSQKSLVRVFLFVCLSLFVFGVVITFNQTAKAADSKKTVDNEEIQAQTAQLLETFHEKKYIGALDEEELKVQTDLQTSASEANKKKKSKEEAGEGF